MKRPSLAVLLCISAAVTAAAQDRVSPATLSVAATKGTMLVAANGARLGPVYRVRADGSAQIFIDGRLVSIPVATLSTANGRLTTTLSKNEVLAIP